VATFLNVGLKLDLSAQDIIFLHAHIEGWAAGLRLLANSFDCLPHQLDRDSLLRNLARNERHVYDFLADEVLNQQEVAMRGFLLETSILTELTPTLCQAVTKCQDVVALLEELYRRNLTIAVEQKQHVYRYHDLFRAFLQHHLARELPQQLTDLHLQAAEAETVPSRVIHHYLEAQFWEEAAVKMEQLGGPLLQEGLLITVRNWINALPLTICQQHPRLLYYLGISAWQRGDTVMVKELLQRAIEGFAASGDAQEQGESLVILANACISDHDTVQGRIYLEEALHFPIASANRALVLMTRAWQENWLRDWEQAARDIDEAIRIGLAEPDEAVWNVLGLLFRAGLSVLPDGLARIERFWHNSMPHQFAEKNMVLKTSLSSLQAFTYLMRGRIDEAAQANERVLQGIDELEGAIWLIGDALIISLRLYLACNDTKRLDHLVAFVHRFKSYPFFETYRFVACYLECRARWQQGQIEEAQQIFQAFPFSDELADAQFLRFLLQALLEIANQQYHQAEATLKAAQELEPKCVLTLYIADVTPILAYLYMQWDKPKKALIELEPILVKCEAENTPGLILQEGAIMFPVLELALKRGCHVDYITKLLHMVGREVTLTEEVVGSNGRLSLREIQVLRLLAEGLSNREIANELIISELTVKSHVTHLLRKLDASSRIVAVTRARQLDLLL
jgi:LuxR family maltose regulon positive regulatory protein